MGTVSYANLTSRVFRTRLLYDLCFNFKIQVAASPQEDENAFTCHTVSYKTWSIMQETLL